MELVPDDYPGPSPAFPEPEYSDWNRADTFVISGPLLHTTRGARAVGRVFHGRIMTRTAARRWVALTYGRFEEIRHPRRWCFRCLKPDAPGGRYTPPGESE